MLDFFFFIILLKCFLGTGLIFSTFLYFKYKKSKKKKKRMIRVMQLPVDHVTCGLLHHGQECVYL